MTPAHNVKLGFPVKEMLRPGGRTERVRQAVATTVLELIQAGVVDFSMQDVAQRAGVARSTLYARWPNRDALITEALTAHSLEFSIEPGDSWQETLRNLAFSFREFSLRPTEIAINSLSAYLSGGFIAAETRRIWSEITKALADHLLEAQAKGEIRHDVNPTNVLISMMTCISGLIVMAKMTPSDAFIEELAAIHIRGCAVSETELLQGRGQALSDGSRGES